MLRISFLLTALVIVASCTSSNPREAAWLRQMTIANELYSQERYVESASACDSASKIFSIASGPQYRAMAIAVRASCFFNLDKLEIADTLFTLALDDPKQWPEDDSLLMNFYLEFADVKRGLGDLSASAEQLHRARLISEKVLSDRNPLKYLVKFSEVATLQELGRWSEALVLCRSLYGQAANVYGKTHEKALDALESYITCKVALKEYSEAEGLLLAELYTLENAHIEESPFIPRFTMELAFVRLRQGKTAEALQTYDIALRDAERMLGVKDVDTEKIRGNYVQVLRDAGQSALADSIENASHPK